MIILYISIYLINSIDVERYIFENTYYDVYKKEFINGIYSSEQ